MSIAESAGLLLYSHEPELQVLLAHPGGPYFANKDLGSWSIPKGLIEKHEQRLTAACREFVEETGYELSAGTRFLPLGQVRLKSRKIVHGWAFEGSWEPGRAPQSNTFEIEWPPRSGRQQTFPEIDRAELFSLETAHQKIVPSQLPFLERLVVCLDTS